LKKGRTYIFCGIILPVLTAFFLFCQPAWASVKGVCSNCHTMHNSEGGSDMVLDPLGGTTWGGDCQGCHSQPREEMLTYTCIGCHAKGTTAIDSPGVLDIPQVYYDGSTELAAGNFKYILTNGDSSGHNVHGWGMVNGGPVIWPDLELDEPPGYNEDMDPSPFSFVSDYPGVLAGRQVLCAGAFGCHGNRAIKSQTRATYGTHHADDSVLKFGTAYDSAKQGATPGTSYRFLNGVEGFEDDDWEYTVSSTDHNEYAGAALSGARISQSEVFTMSQFCASCHGNFHMSGGASGTGIGDSSAWIRHPTDVQIPSGASYPYKDYVNYMTDSGTDPDELSVRVARIDLSQVETAPGNTTQITDDNAAVFCLSCHKAHASQYPDMLRFDYEIMKTGGADAGKTGCFACHRDK